MLDPYPGSRIGAGTIKISGRDITTLPVHDRSAAWLSHMDTDVDLHPDFGPSYGDGPNYGIPITVVGKKHAKSKVSFDYSSESDHVKYPVGNDTKIEGGRGSDGDRHAIIVDKDKCKLYELFAAQKVGSFSVNRRPDRSSESSDSRTR